MVEWERVERDLNEAGYPDFEFDSGETAVPGLSGAWLVGKLSREGRLARENLPLPWRLIDALPVGSAVPTDPEYAPDEVRRIAAEHALDVIIVSCGADWVRIALCDPA